MFITFFNKKKHFFFHLFIGTIHYSEVNKDKKRNETEFCTFCILHSEKKLYSISNSFVSII